MCQRGETKIFFKVFQLNLEVKGPHPQTHRLCSHSPPHYILESWVPYSRKRACHAAVETQWED